ncbi:MAG: pyridoxal-phosphate dependent enzyme [Acidithiobacillales bacterium]
MPADYPLAAAEEAARRVHAVLPPTPQYRGPLLSRRAGAEVWVKHENHTPVGAFKVRGGIALFHELRASHPSLAGVIAAARGNHGQSVAFSAARAGLPAVIVVPRGNSVGKNAAMRALGAELVSDRELFASVLAGAEAP